MAPLDLLIERPSADDGPDELAVLRQELDGVAHALRRLTPEQREAIELRFFAGLSAKEAAVAMDRQEGTIRGLQFRAIAALRRDLGIEPGADRGLARVSGKDPMNEDEMTGAEPRAGEELERAARTLRDGSGWIPARPRPGVPARP